MSTAPVTTAPSIDVAQLSVKMSELLDQFQALMPDFMAPDPARRQRVAQRARFGEQMILPMAATSDNYGPCARRTSSTPMRGGWPWPSATPFGRSH